MLGEWQPFRAAFYDGKRRNFVVYNLVLELGAHIWVDRSPILSTVMVGTGQSFASKLLNFLQTKDSRERCWEESWENDAVSKISIRVHLASSLVLFRGSGRLMGRTILVGNTSTTLRNLRQTQTSWHTLNWLGFKIDFHSSDWDSE